MTPILGEEMSNIVIRELKIDRTSDKLSKLYIGITSLFIFSIIGVIEIITGNIPQSASPTLILKSNVTT